MYLAVQELMQRTMLIRTIALACERLRRTITELQCRDRPAPLPPPTSFPQNSYARRTATQTTFWPRQAAALNV